MVNAQCATAPGAWPMCVASPYCPSAPGMPTSAPTSSAGQSGGQQVPAIVAALAHGHCRQIGERQDEELHARPIASAHDDRYRDRRLLHSAHEHCDGAEEDRIRQRLRHEVAVVDHRRRRNRRRCGEQCVRRAHDLPGEPVGREDGRGHDRRVQQLRRRVGVRHRAEQPRRAPARAARAGQGRRSARRESRARALPRATATALRRAARR